MKNEKRKKYVLKEGIDFIIKLVLAVALFTFLAVTGKTIGLTVIIKLTSIIILVVNTIILDKYGRI